MDAKWLQETFAIKNLTIKTMRCPKCHNPLNPHTPLRCPDCECVVNQDAQTSPQPTVEYQSFDVSCEWYDVELRSIAGIRPWRYMIIGGVMMAEEAVIFIGVIERNDSQWEAITV